MLGCMFFHAVTVVVALLVYSRGSRQMAAILDQKNYLEELNRHLKYDALHSVVISPCGLGRPNGFIIC